MRWLEIMARRAAWSSIDPVTVMLANEYRRLDAPTFEGMAHRRILRVAVAVLRNAVPVSLDVARRALDTTDEFLNGSTKSGLFMAFGDVERMLDAAHFVRSMRGRESLPERDVIPALTAVLGLGRYAASGDEDGLIGAMDHAAVMSRYRFSGARSVWGALASAADFARWALAEHTGPTMAEQAGVPNGDLLPEGATPEVIPEIVIPPAQWTDDAVRMLREFYATERQVEAELVDPARMASRMLDALGPMLALRISREVSPTAIVDFNAEDGADNTEHEIAKRVLTQLKKAAKKAAKRR